MARSIGEIYDEMASEKETLVTLSALQPNIDNTQLLLSDLTSRSKVAVWRLIFFVISVSIWVHEKLFDKYALEVESRSKEIIPGPIIWYREISFNFQFGDSLLWIKEKYQYSIIDDLKKIIKRCSVIDRGGQVRIKVAKLDNNNQPVPLSYSQVTAFYSYINLVKMAGTNVEVINREADLLRINYDIYYNPLVLKQTGESIENPGVFPVKDSINTYIQDLPFDGVLNINRLTDRIQAIKGVIDPVITFSASKYGGLDYQEFTKDYASDAGYMKVDPAFPLSSSLNYITDV